MIGAIKSRRSGESPEAGIPSMVKVILRLAVLLPAMALVAVSQGQVAPVITTHPTSTILPREGRVSLVVQAQGTSPLSYQWERNGLEIAGATGSSYEVAANPWAAVGQYRVVVSNSSGKAASDFARVDMSGSLWRLGAGFSARLNDPIPGYIRTTAAPVANQVKKAAVGWTTSLFLKTDGSLWGMGNNMSGMLGDGTTVSRRIPAKIAESVVDMDAAPSATFFIKSDGSLWYVGYMQEVGQAWVPVQIASSVAKVAAGMFHAMILKQDGSLWTMGSNYSGALGDGTGVNAATPVMVASSVANIAAGVAFSLFLKIDGSLWACGLNHLGQLGDGTTENRLVPVQVASDVSDLAAGEYQGLFVKRDGSLHAMGRASDGSNDVWPVPRKVGESVAKFTGGFDNTFFIKTDGSL